MIYRNEVLINWKTGKSQDEVKVKEEITEIKNKYFSDKTHKLVRINYPKGEFTMSANGAFEVPKLFPVRLYSTDGQWRWSKARMGNKTKTNPSGFQDHHLNIRHQHVLSVKDIEFLWFLLNRSSDLNKRIYIEDLEGEATEKVEEMASDVDIRYMLMGNTSPIAKDEQLIRQVADVFGVRDADKMQLNQLKLALYEKTVEGQNSDDKFVNFEKFNELTQGNKSRKLAFLARRAITDKLVGYSVTGRAWHLMSGKNYEEKLMDIKATEAADREQVFISEVINNANVRDRLLSALGEDDEITQSDLEEMTHPALKQKLRELTGEFDAKLKKDDLVKKICENMKIEYVPAT